jgi:hypothetical protein
MSLDDLVVPIDVFVAGLIAIIGIYLMADWIRRWFATRREAAIAEDIMKTWADIHKQADNVLAKANISGFKTTNVIKQVVVPKKQATTKKPSEMDLAISKALAMEAAGPFAGAVTDHFYGRPILEASKEFTLCAKCSGLKRITDCVWDANNKRFGWCHVCAGIVKVKADVSIKQIIKQASSDVLAEAKAKTPVPTNPILFVKPSMIYGYGGANAWQSIEGVKAVAAGLLPKAETPKSKPKKPKPKKDEPFVPVDRKKRAITLDDE